MVGLRRFKPSTIRLYEHEASQNVFDHRNNNKTIKIACSYMSNLGFFVRFVFSRCALVDILKLNENSPCKQNE